MFKNMSDEDKIKYRRYAVYGVIIVFIVGVFAFNDRGKNIGEKKQKIEKEISPTLPDSARSIGLVSLNRDIQSMQKAVVSLQDSVNNINRTLSTVQKSQSDSNTRLERRFKQLEDELLNTARVVFKEKIGELGPSDFGLDMTEYQSVLGQINQKAQEQRDLQAFNRQIINSGNNDEEQAEASAPILGSVGGENIFAVSEKPRFASAYDDPSQQGSPSAAITVHRFDRGSAITQDANAIDSINERTVTVLHPNDERRMKKQQQKNKEVYIPSGSLLTGVALTGFDAMTDESAVKNPTPLLIRLKGFTILPNNHNVDLSECFVMAGGYGSLSDERAHIRSETISCVDEKGNVTDVRFNAVALGEDGKVGLRGRLVSRQGSVIAQNMLAGFIGGLGTMFGTAHTPVIGTGTDGTIKLPDLKTVGLGGASSGISRSMEKLSDTLSALADKIYPIIEIDAGRQVGFVVVSGLNLKGGTR